MAVKKNPYVKTRKDGRLAFLDDNGKVVAEQKVTKMATTKFMERSHIWENNKNGVALFIAQGMDATNLPDDFQLFPKTDKLMMSIIQLIADGCTLREIGQQPGMPPLSVVMRWCGQDEDFKKALDEARRSRAEVYHDKLVHTVETVKEYNSKSSKVKVDGYKFLMGVNDRDRFGNQTKIVGDPNMPVHFTINTGIQEAPIPIQGRTIDIDEAGNEIKETSGTDINGVQPEATPAGDPPEPKKI